MAISVRDLTAKEEFTMREVALDRGFSYLPFSLRELITPQLQFGQDPFPTERDGSYPDNRPGVLPDEAADDRLRDISVLESTRTRWANWLDDFVEDPARRLEPTDRTQLRQAMVNILDIDGGETEIRSVGSGHSHSNAAEPSKRFLDLSRMKGALSHEGWLAELEDRSTASTTAIRRPHSRGIFEKENLVRVRAGTVLKRLNREILPNHGDTDKTPPGKALKNMGSWDGQTLAGAINTGTHGTGHELGSLADVVQSVEIATVPEARSGVPIVQLYRIEPDGGITDREKFEADTGDHEMELIQDDDVFYSTVVGYGCMGNVVAYTIEVRDAYWLRELTETWRWTGSDQKEGLKTKLEDNPTNNFLSQDRGPVEFQSTRHASFLLNLPDAQYENVNSTMYPENNNPHCLVRRRKEVPPKEKPSDWPSDESFPPERQKTPFRDSVQENLTPYPLGNSPLEFAALEGTPLARSLGKNFRNRLFTKDYPMPTLNASRPRSGPFVEGLFDTASYIALRRRPAQGTPLDEPAPPVIDVITSEIAVPLSDVTEAVELIIELARLTGIEVDGTGYNVFFVAPLGVRFVARSHHHLSPEYHPDPEDEGTEPMALLEVPLPVVEYESKSSPSDMPELTKEETRDDVTKRALDQIVWALAGVNEEYEFGGRPHMGKHFTLDGDDLRELYPRFDGDGGWLETYERFNAFGTFNNAFTDQLGISMDHPDLPDPPEISPPVELPLADTAEATGSEDSDSESDSDSGIGGSGPGFGVVTGLSALGGYAWWRHRSPDDPDSDAGDE